jgi:N-methylhydantoinase B
VLETAYPLRIERYELRTDSGGAGEFRGGLGLRRDIAVRGDGATFSLLADRRVNAPYGLLGGDAGACGEDYLIRDGEGIRLPQKSTHELDTGDVVSVRTPGAGGYGDPANRDPEAVRNDVALGKVSADAARTEYGVEVENEETGDADD